MTGDGGVFRLVYASRSLIAEEQVPIEILRILDAARRNNAGGDITGALLFSADAFVQVLEGRMAAVEQAFERIQCDPRHAEVVVLEAAPAPRRDFEGWSMAFAGRRPDLHLAALGTIPGQAGPGGASPAMLDVLRGALGRRAGEPAAA
jgi:Sensors of blue-light using FAD